MVQPYHKMQGSHRVSIVMIDNDKEAIIQKVRDKIGTQALSNQEVAHISMDEILKHFKQISEVEKREFLEKVLNDVLGQVKKDQATDYAVRSLIIEEAVQRVSPGCGCECVIC